MFFQALEDLFFSIFIQSGFLFQIFLRVFKWIRNYIMPSPNHFITDDSGCKLNALKIDGMVFPTFDNNMLVKLKNLRLRDTDILICGYPKTGCHWTYEILYMIINNTTELSKGGKVYGGMIDLLPTLLLDSMPSPRILSTHVLFEYLPRDIKNFKTKIVFTERNAKDIVVSYYNHHKAIKPLFGDYKGSFNDYYKLFMTGQLDYGCFFDYTQKWHSAMASQSDNDIFLLCYEELKKNPVAMIKKLAEFLDVSISDEFAESVSLSSRFDNMKARAENYKVKLFRKGTVGDWKNWMTDEQGKQIDDKWEETIAKIEVMKRDTK